MAPRVALLVHNRLEVDPRVSRHARAALRAGYRVAVLSVGVECAAPRWGERVEGIAVFESRIVGRTMLGHLRTIARRLRKTTRNVARALESGTTRAASASVPHGHGPGQRSPLLQHLKDVTTIALLVRNNLGVYRQFKGIGAALVHANDLNVLPAGYLLARRWRAPLLYDSHELWTQLDEGWSPLLRTLYGRLERALIRRANATITVNSAIAAELARRYDVPVPTVVMNCPDVGTSQDPSRPPVVHLPVRLIYQGMLNPNRGLLELVDALARVPSVALDIRGPGALAESLRQRIALLEIGERVRVLPPVPMRELVSALDGYDAGIVPYLPVGMNNLLCSPNKLFEYMAAGLAVICSDLPVLREVVISAGCGLLYAPGEEAALVGALRAISSDAERLHLWQQRARAAALTRYNAAHEEGIMLRVYERLLHGRIPRKLNLGGT